MNGKRIKIDTRDKELYEMIALWLADAGYDVAENGEGEAESLAADLYIIDTETVSKEEKERTKNREKKGGRIIYITDAEGEEEEEEDSLSRPFTRLEFLYAVREKCGGGELLVRVDHKRKRIYNKKAYVTLTDKEYAIFRLLFDRLEECVSRNEISAIARGGEQKTNAADVYICMLRRKLTELFGTSPIKTVRGQGYSLSLETR